MANRDAGKELYRWSIYTIDGLPEKASNGLEVTPDGSIETAQDFSILFVCGGAEIADAWSKPLQFALRRIAKRNNIKLGALCTGSYLLARAGLLDGYKCTIHWENIASLRDRHLATFARNHWITEHQLKFAFIFTQEQFKIFRALNNWSGVVYDHIFEFARTRAPCIFQSQFYDDRFPNRHLATSFWRLRPGRRSTA